MPTPSRTSLSEIVRAGRDIVEARGLDGLTMGTVAAAVGVKAPSLYKHVGNRGELVKLIAESTLADLATALDSSIDGTNPRRDLTLLATTFRDFARANPEAYRLIFSPMPEAWRPSADALQRASRAVLVTSEALVGPEHSLEAARMITAWGHGFLTMELTGTFRLGGDLDEAFAYGVERLVGALAAG